MPELRKSPRLTEFDYTGAYTYSLTLVTRQRYPFFGDDQFIWTAQKALEDACHRHGFTLHAYCFMPDHLHILISGAVDSRLQPCVTLFKQLSGYAAKQQFGRSLWQISYYDHILRSEEAVEGVAAYIWDNPVRAGLVDDMRDYPFSGPRSLLEAMGGPQGLQLRDDSDESFRRLGLA